MGHREGFTGPGHLHAPALEPAIGLIVPTVAPGGVGVEHHPHPHPPLLGPQQGCLDRFGLQLELLQAQFTAGLVDQCDHRLSAVIGHHQQALVVAKAGYTGGHWDFDSLR